MNSSHPNYTAKQLTGSTPVSPPIRHSRACGNPSLAGRMGPRLRGDDRNRTTEMPQSVATKKPTGWGAGGQVVLFMVEVARVELASKYVKYSATTGLVSCCTLRSAGSRRPALHDFPFGTLWQGTGTTLAFETPIDAPLTDPGMDDPERR